jgi:hypothetical protein
MQDPHQAYEVILNEVQWPAYSHLILTLGSRFLTATEYWCFSVYDKHMLYIIVSDDSHRNLQHGMQDLNMDGLTALLSPELEAPEDLFSGSSADCLPTLKHEWMCKPNAQLEHSTDRCALHTLAMQMMYIAPYPPRGH